MKIKHWLEAARLRTLPLSVSGIIVASCLAASKGIFNWQIFTLAMLTTISLQVLSNFANDYGDGVKGTDNEDRIGPMRALQSGNITAKSMLNGIKLNIIICLILSVGLIFAAFGSDHFLLALLFFIIGVSSIYAAIKYTVGSNAYGYRGLGDVFVFVFFGLVSVIGCYVLYSKQLDFITVLPACAIGLLSAAVLNLNNMRDIESDRKANKNTLVVKMGSVKAKYYHYFLVVTAMVLSLLFGVLNYESPNNFIYLITFIPLGIHLKTVKDNTKPVLLDPELKKLALTTFFLSVLLGIGQLI
ncbi:1,4-dihydroxy-2-naphthoate prenyltransferase [Oceanihabitans sediminis]|nr:1,4-dihydroxy-2-naphthoate prenyltransferase [Oceanihabitans sediminis]